MKVAIPTLLACGLAVLFCIANHVCRSGFPAVSLWLFRHGEERKS